MWFVRFNVFHYTFTVRWIISSTTTIKHSHFQYTKSTQHCQQKCCCNNLVTYVFNNSHHHHHQSFNEGRWGTTDDITTSFLHFSLFSSALWNLPNSRPVHSLMLSSHLFLCLPCRPAINLCLTYSGQSVVSVNSALSEFDSNPGSFQHRPHKWGKKSKRNLFGRCPASCVAVRYYAGRLLKKCLLDFIPRLQLREVWSLKKNNHTKTKTVIQSMVIFRKFEAKSLMLANSPHHFRLISP